MMGLKKSKLLKIRKKILKKYINLQIFTIRLCIIVTMEGGVLFIMCIQIGN